MNPHNDNPFDANLPEHFQNAMDLDDNTLGVALHQQRNDFRLEPLGYRFPNDIPHSHRAEYNNPQPPNPIPPHTPFPTEHLLLTQLHHSLTHLLTLPHTNEAEWRETQRLIDVADALRDELEDLEGRALGAAMGFNPGVGETGRERGAREGLGERTRRLFRAAFGVGERSRGRGDGAGRVGFRGEDAGRGGDGEGAGRGVGRGGGGEFVPREYEGGRRRAQRRRLG